LYLVVHSHTTIFALIYNVATPATGATKIGSPV
jgi:hypothetical protein